MKRTLNAVPASWQLHLLLLIMLARRVRLQKELRGRLEPVFDFIFGRIMYIYLLCLALAANCLN